MKKRKAPKTNAIRLLEMQHIPFTVHEYSWDELHMNMQKSSVPVNAHEAGAYHVYKTIVIKGNRTPFLVACLPIKKELDLKKLASASGNKKVELLPLEHLEQVTGYIRGGCSPIGMKKPFPTYLAQSAVRDQQIMISAGKRGLQIGLTPGDLIKATAAELADIEAQPQ